MATQLDKDLTRESTLKIGEREILVTLTANQEIKLKLKGMKSGELLIGIDQLYAQLSGNSLEDVEEPKSSTRTSISIINDDEDKPTKNSILIDLHELRSMNAISGLDAATLSKFDGVISDLIKQKKEIKESQRTINALKKKK